MSLPQIFQPLYRYRMLLNGALMVMLMAWRPQGIMGTSAAARATRLDLGRGKRARGAEAPLGLEPKGLPTQELE